MHDLPQIIMSSLLIFIISLLSVTGNGVRANTSSSASSCGDIGSNISCPFYLEGHHQQKCLNFSHQLSCQNNRTIIQISKHDFYVEVINYVNSSVRIIDSGLAENNYSCSSLPLKSFSKDDIYGNSYSPIAEMNTPITYIDCPAPVINSSSTRRYKPTPPCSSSISSYVVTGYMDSSEVENNCTIRKATWVSSAWPDINKTSFLDIHDMAYGIELPFEYFSCLTCHPPPSPYCRAVEIESFRGLDCSAGFPWSFFWAIFFSEHSEKFPLFSEPILIFEVVFNIFPLFYASLPLPFAGK